MIKYTNKLKEFLIKENRNFCKREIEDKELLTGIKVIDKCDNIVEYTAIFKKVANVENYNVNNYREYVLNSSKFFREVLKYCNFDFKIEDIIEYNEPIDIFISHSSGDDYIMHNFRKLLIEHGVSENNIFMEHARDILELTPGERYLDEIKRHIMSCDVFICLINENFSSSQMCNIEYGIAFAYDLLILPFYSNETAKYNDKIYNNTAHIEPIYEKRYLEKVLQLLDVNPINNKIERFIMKFDKES